MAYDTRAEAKAIECEDCGAMLVCSCGCGPSPISLTAALRRAFDAGLERALELVRAEQLVEMRDNDGDNAHRASLASRTPPTTDARNELLERASVLIETSMPASAISHREWLADYRALRGGR